MKRYDKFLNILIGITGAFVLCAYVSFALQFGFRTGNLKAILLSLTVILMVLVPILFRKAWKKLLKRSYKVIKNIYAYGMTFYFVTFILLCSYIGIKANTELTPQNMPQGSAVLVFGCKVNGTVPSRTLRLRLDTALKLLEEDSSSVCLVSGGQGIDEDIAEAVAMQQYLVEKGIDAERIYIDAEAMDTIENFGGFRKIISENGLNDRPLIAVSSDFHIARIQLLAMRNGLTVSTCSAPSSDPWQLWTSLVREYMSYVKLFLGV